VVREIKERRFRYTVHGFERCFLTLVPDFSSKLN
jgi:hypothetical protein